MFCEECGAQLEPGARFCENCGTPVPQEAQINTSSTTQTVKSDFDLFTFDKSDWTTAYKNLCFKNPGKEAGVIVTSLSRLAAQLNCEMSELQNLIKQYASYSLAYGVVYTLLNIDNQIVTQSYSVDVENVVNALKKINAVSKLKYAFILGNEAVINVAEWTNGAMDNDSCVPSDLVYSTLCTKSPWEGNDYVFEKVLRVGRLVSYDGEPFLKFSSYFENIMYSPKAFPSNCPYGLSALVWKNETDFEYGRIFTKQTDSSPYITKNIVQGCFENSTNIFYINLHGSNKTKYWYGQDGDSFPEAFEPDVFDKLNSPFIVGVEACYGAKFKGNLTPAESILVKAMQSGCVSFLGSSMIAYGASQKPGSCADLVVGEFINQISQGKSAGDSLVLGNMRLSKESVDFSDTEIKTLAEFALYGDPAYKISYGNQKSSGAKSFSGVAGVRGLYVNIPDIRSAMKMSLTQVDEKISNAINAYVNGRYTWTNGIEPETYKMDGKDLFQSIYKKTGAVDGLDRTVKIYFDQNGNIKKELESK